MNGFLLTCVCARLCLLDVYNKRIKRVVVLIEYLVYQSL